MAAGSAGDVAIPMMGDPDEVPNMRATMERMVDSIITLQTQMAELMEDPDNYQGSKGPAVRAKVYDHAIEADRIKMDRLEEVINRNTSLLDDLEASLASYSSELKTDRDQMVKMNEALRTSVTTWLPPVRPVQAIGGTSRLPPEFEVSTSYMSTLVQ